MRKAFRHTGVLMMVAVVALGLIGAAYTLWYEELVIEAKVETGRFNADWSLHCDEGPSVRTGTDPDCAEAVVSLNQAAGPFKTAQQWGPILTSYTRVGDKMPRCGATLNNDGENEANDVADKDYLKLYLGNLYPYAGCKLTVDITNSGTVPMHFTVEYKNKNGNLDLSWLDVQTAVNSHSSSSVPAAQKDRVCAIFKDFLTGNDLTVGQQLKDAQNDYLQLHGGETVWCDLVVYLKQIAGAEGKSVEIRLDLVAHQWNEGVTATDPHTGIPAPQP